MKITVTNTKIQDLDFSDIAHEYRDRKMHDDGPYDDEIMYYLHRGHRVFFNSLVDTNGKSINFDVTDEVLEAFRAIEEQVNELIRATGSDAKPNWIHSGYAGCGMCSCSPGFFVDGSLPAKEVWIDVEVDVNA